MGLSHLAMRLALVDKAREVARNIIERGKIENVEIVINIKPQL